MLLIRGDYCLDLADIVCRAHKRQRHRIDSVLQAKFEVLAVFFRQRRNRKRRSRQIDSLIFSKRAAVNNLTFDVFAVHCLDAQLNAPIRKQDTRPGPDLLRKTFERS